MADIFDMLSPDEEAPPVDIFDQVAGDQAGDIFDQVASTKEEPPKPKSSLLAEALEGAGLFGSFAVSSQGLDQNGRLERRKDGHFRLPYMEKKDESLVGGAAQGFEWLMNPLENRHISPGHEQGYRTTVDKKLTPIDMEAQKVFHKFQQDNNLSDDELSDAFHDVIKMTNKFNDGEKARVLSDGNVLPNPDLADWLDTDKAHAIIDSLSISSDAKAREKEVLKIRQKMIADHKMVAWSAASAVSPMEGPMEWAERTGRKDQWGTPELALAYEKEVASKAGVIQGASASGAKGAIKLSMTLAGAGGYISGSEKVAEKASDLAYASAMISSGSVDIGLVGSVIEEAPSLIAQIALTRGVGSGFAALGGSQAVGATTAMLTTSFLQSAGMTFANEIESGATIAEAREAGTRAGVVTAVVTGAFQKVGFGGLEKKMVGPGVGEMTMRELFKAKTRAEVWKNVRQYAKELGIGVTSEGAEEGLDEFMQTFVNADPDTNLSDAWTNGLEALKVGAAIGGVAHVAVNEYDAAFNKDAMRLAPQTMAAVRAGMNSAQASSAQIATPAGLAGGAKMVYDQLQAKMEASVLREQTEEEYAAGIEPPTPGPPLTAKESEELAYLKERVKEDGTFDPDTLDGFRGNTLAKGVAPPTGAPMAPLSTSAATGAPAAQDAPAFVRDTKKGIQVNREAPVSKIAEAVFGPAPAGMEYKDDAKPDDFKIKKDRTVTYKGRDTNRRMRSDGQIEVLPPDSRPRITTPTSFLKPVVTPGPANGTQQEVLDDVDAQQAPPPATGIPASEQPAPNTPARSTEFVPARPERVGRDASARDAWDDQYGNMRKGGRSHNDDGTPYQPTVMDELGPRIGLVMQRKTFDEQIDAIGAGGGAELGTAVKQLLDDGWAWDDTQERMVDPQNRGENPTQALVRIRSTPAPSSAAKLPSQFDIALVSLREGLASGKLTMDDIKAKASWKKEKGSLDSSNEQKTYEQIAATELLAEQPATTTPIAQSAPVAKPVTVPEKVVTNAPAAEKAVTSSSPAAAPKPLSRADVPSSQIVEDSNDGSLPVRIKIPLYGLDAAGIEKRDAWDAKYGKDYDRSTGVLLSSIPNLPPVEPRPPISIGAMKARNAGVTPSFEDALADLAYDEWERKYEKTHNSDGSSKYRPELQPAPPASVASTKDEQSSTLSEQDETKKQAEPVTETEEQVKGQVLSRKEASERDKEIESLEASMESARTRNPDTYEESAGYQRMAEKLERLRDDSGLRAPEPGPPTPAPNAKITEAQSIALPPDGIIKESESPVGPLEESQAIIVTDENGETTSVRIVEKVEMNEAGEMIYKLSDRIGNNNIRRDLESGNRSSNIDASDVASALSTAQELLNSSTEKSEQTVLGKINTILHNALSRVSNKAYADSKIVFTTDGPKVVAKPEGRNVSIRVNGRKWAALLRARMNGVDPNSPLAEQIVRDFLMEAQALMWHESKHDYLYRVYNSSDRDRERVRSVMRELFDHVSNPGNEHTLSFFAQRARGRNPEVLRDKSDADVLDWIVEQGDDEVFAVGAETLADFIQRLRSGMDSLTIQEAANRFIEGLIGDPQKMESRKAKSLVARVVELLNRGLEAMKRFMEAHRMAGTLPESFVNLAIEIDQLMEGGGIVAPDFQDVLSRSMGSLSSRMARVNTVEDELSKKRFGDGETARSEWDVKDQVRKAIRHIMGVDPSAPLPVAINRVTGRLEVDKDIEQFTTPEIAKALRDNIDLLNDPRRSFTAIDASEAAKDMRIIARNLNLGIPVGPTSGSEVSPTFNEGIFRNSAQMEDVLPVLNENLEVELESRVGISPKDLVDHINNKRLSVQVDPTTSAVPQDVADGVSAVRKVIDNTPEGKDINERQSKVDKKLARFNKDRAEITGVEESIGQIREQLRDAVKIHGDKSEQAKELRERLDSYQKSLAPMKARLEKLHKEEDALREELLILNAARHYVAEAFLAYNEPEPSGFTAADIIKRQEHATKIGLRRSVMEARAKERQANSELNRLRVEQEIGQSRVRDIHDLAMMAYNQDELERLTEGLDINPAVLNASLRKIHDVRVAFANVLTIPDRLEYMLIGGRKPASMRKEQANKSWRAISKIDAANKNSLALLPMSATRTIRGNVPENDLDIDVLGDDLKIEIVDGDNPITFTTSSDFIPPAWKDSTIDATAIQIHQAALASSRLLGFNESDRKDLDSSGDERRVGYKRNAAALGADLALNFRYAMIAGDPAATSVSVDQGGFPSRAVTDNNGAIGGFLDPEVVPLLPISESMFTRPETDEGKAQKVDEDMAHYAQDLVSVARFLNSIETGQGMHTRAVLWHGQSMTPAGAAYSILAPRFLEFVALTKEPSRPNKDSQRKMNYQAAMRASFEKRIESLRGQRDSIQALGTNPDGSMEPALFNRLMKIGSDISKAESDLVVFDSIYSKLLPGLESAPVIRGMNDRLDGLGSKFWIMREGAVAANLIYESAVEAISEVNRVRHDESKEGIDTEARNPLDEGMMRESAFHTAQIKSVADRAYGDASRRGAAISLLRPVAAWESLQVLDRLEEEHQRVVRIGKGIADGSLKTEEDVRLMYEGDDRRSDTNLEEMSDQMSNAVRQRLMEQMERQEEMALEREERGMTAVLLSMFGGDHTAVRRVRDSFVYLVEVGGESITEEVVGGETGAQSVTDDFGNRVIGAPYEMVAKTRQYTKGGTPELRYDRKAMRAFIRSELERMHATEVKNGSILSSWSYEMDSKTKNRTRNMSFDNLFEDKGREKGLISRNEGFRAMLEQIRATGGTLHAVTELDAFRPERLEGSLDREKDWMYDSTASDVFNSLVSRIGNVSILTGHIPWSASRGDLDTRIPTFAFIPDAKHPMVVMPYGRFQPTKEEASAALESLFLWMADNGGVDLFAAVKPVMESLSTLSAERANFTIHSRTALDWANILADKDIIIIPQEDYDVYRDNLALGEDMDQELNEILLDDYPRLRTKNPRYITSGQFDSMVKSMAASTINRANLAIADMHMALSDVIDPSLMEELIENRTILDKRQNAVYAKILAQALTNPSVKELLVIAATEDQEVALTKEDNALFGNLIGYHNVRGMAEMAARDSMQQLRESGMEVEDEMGRSSAQGEKFGRLDQQWGDTLKAMGVSLHGDVAVTDGSFDPLAPARAEWANQMLHSALRRLFPTRDSSQPMTGEPRESGLTEYQARQLLSIFGQDLIAEAMAEAGAGTDGRWGSPQYLRTANVGGVAPDRPVTAADIVAATGNAAKELQEMFYRGWSLSGKIDGNGRGSRSSLDALQRYGSYGFLDPLMEGGVRNEWEANRQGKGAIWAAESVFGIEFDQMEGMRTATAVPDLAKWEKLAKSKALLKWKMTPYLENGELNPDGETRVTVFEAMKRSVMREASNNREYLASAKKVADGYIGQHRRSKEAIDVLEQLSKDLEAQSVEQLVNELASNRRSAPHRIAFRVLRQFMRDQEQTAGSLADEVLRNFIRAQSEIEHTAFDDPFSPDVDSVIDHKNHIVHKLRAIAAKYKQTTRDASYVVSKMHDNKDTPLLRESRLQYNADVNMALSEIQALNPELFGHHELRMYSIRSTDTPNQARRRAAKFTGLLNSIGDPRALRGMVRSLVRRNAIRGDIRVESSIRSAMDDITSATSKFVLSSEAQKSILQALYDKGFKLGGRGSTIRDLAGAKSAIQSIIYQEMQNEKNAVEEAKSLMISTAVDMAEKIRLGKLRRADDVLRILRAADDIDPESPLNNRLVRDQALVEMLSRSLSDLSRRHERVITGHLLQIAISQHRAPKFAAFQVSGFAALRLVTRKNAESASDADVEIARRVLNEYGKMWSRTYMDNYGKDDFVVGSSMSEQAANTANDLSSKGAGSMLKKGGKTYRVSEGLLEPLDARQRVAAILRHRRSKATPELVMARAKAQAARGLHIPKEDGDSRLEIEQELEALKVMLEQTKEDWKTSNDAAIRDGVKDRHSGRKALRARINAITKRRAFLESELVRNLAQEQEQRPLKAQEMESSLRDRLASAIDELKSENKQSKAGLDLAFEIDQIKRNISTIRKARAGMTGELVMGDLETATREEFLTNRLEGLREKLASTKAQIMSVKKRAKASPEGKAQERNMLRKRMKKIKDEMDGIEAELSYDPHTDSPPSLFAPTLSSAVQQGIESDADRVVNTFNPASFRSSSMRANIASVSSGAKAAFGNHNPDMRTRAILRQKVITAKTLLATGELANAKLRGTKTSLHQELADALVLLEANPNDQFAHARFSDVQLKAAAYAWSADKVDVIASGYVFSKGMPIESKWFVSSFIHESAKNMGLFAKSLDAQSHVNNIRSILNRGLDGRGGKDAYRKDSKTNHEIIAKALIDVPKKERFRVAARGLLLGQIRSYKTAHKSTVRTAKEVLLILNQAQEGMARANAASEAATDTINSSSPIASFANFISRKTRQLWNRANESGFHQIDNQGVMMEMFNEIIPILESAIAIGRDEALEDVLAHLEHVWSDGGRNRSVSNYEKVLTGVFHENVAGLANAIVMEGGDPQDVFSRPLIPFVWANQSMVRPDIVKSGSVYSMIDPRDASWFKNPNRKWEEDEEFDLLDFDGITAPLRILDDIAYRYNVAPAYQAVAAIMGDPATSSREYSMFQIDDGEMLDGALVQISEDRKNSNLITSKDHQKAQWSALAVSNMMKDQIMNDILGFSAATRAINLYRKIAIIGLGRKLISLGQAYAQPLAPVIGYLSTNLLSVKNKRLAGGRGAAFVPVLLKYNKGIVPIDAVSGKDAAFSEAVDKFVADYAPVIAARSSDSIDLLRQIAQDSRLGASERQASPFLGSTSPVLAPVAQAAGWGIDKTYKGVSWTLEQLIGKQESHVIKPMLAHEAHWVLNQSKTDSGEPLVTLDEMLADPVKAGLTPVMLQHATVRVEELFGTSETSQKARLFQPSKTLRGEIVKGMLTTLAGHPQAMASNSWAAYRMMRHNLHRPNSPEFKNGLRIMLMTVGQNLSFVYMTAPVGTYLISNIMAFFMGLDEEERRKMEGSWYGIIPGEPLSERRKKISYWVMALLGRNEDPYGYSWHQGEWTDEQAKKHDGYRRARLIQELLNQAPIIGSLTSTTLGGSLLEAGLKATELSPKSAVKEAGIVLPEKWGFSGTSNIEGSDTPAYERAVYRATKVWFNYLNDSSSMAFFVDALLSSFRYASNNPNDLDAMDVAVVAAALFAPKPREVDRAIERHISIENEDQISLAEWDD
jgi:hypothetical protein